jgi:hypothetical protein
VFRGEFTSITCRTGQPLTKRKKGSTKGCLCDPQTEDRITYYDTNFHQAILDAFSELQKQPNEPHTACPNLDISPVSSKFLVDKTANGFCEEVMKNLDSNFGPTAYDIDGNKIPLLMTAKAEEDSARRALVRRSPPENSENYKDYKFFLSYKHEDGDCWLPKEDLCKDAFRALVSSPCE